MTSSLTLLIDCPVRTVLARALRQVKTTIRKRAANNEGLYCTLTLLVNAVRTGSALSDGTYGEPSADDLARFRYDFAAIQSVVTSTAQIDSGLFETNLQDERYLPFEGADLSIPRRP